MQRPELHRFEAMARSGSSSKRSSLYADLENLRTQFSSLDPTNTGYIGYEELKTLAQSESGLDEAMVPELLERLDRDKDGKVTARVLFFSLCLQQLHTTIGMFRRLASTL